MTSNSGKELGSLMLDLDGLELTDRERELMIHPQVGGLILFSRNFHNTHQLQQLVNEVRELRPELIIAVDQEGGRVQRFKEGFTLLPPMGVFGEIFDKDQDRALELVKDCGWLMASEILAFKIDISFAPVLDLDFGVSSVIGDRSFHRDPENVATLAGAFIQGMKQAGMAATGKHFPGHGYVAGDSHFDIPVDNRSLEDIDQSDMTPFKTLIKQGLSGIMPAHVIYDRCCDQPAGFSKFWIQEQLRNKLGFDGVVFSDDLSMEGATVAGSFENRADAALDAGCDMVLVCNHREGAEAVLKHLEMINARTDQKRLQKLKGNSQLRYEELRSSQHWLEVNKEISSLKNRD